MSTFINVVMLLKGFCVPGTQLSHGADRYRESFGGTVRIALAVGLHGGVMGVQTMILSSSPIGAVTVYSGMAYQFEIIHRHGLGPRVR